MGWGARLGFGCNIGANVGEHASGSFARLGLVRRRAAGLLHRHRAPAAGSACREGVSRCAPSMPAVFVLGFAALLEDSLTSPSAGRPVSPEDFKPAPAAPCGAPCPSVLKK